MTKRNRSQIPGNPAGRFAAASAVGLGAILGVLALPGCGAPPAAELAPPDQAYEVRGVVYEITRSERERSQIVIRHQAIPQFVGRDGDVVGMESMSMPFHVDGRVSLADIEEGNAVAFRFEVRWEAEPTLLITSLEKLPPGTEVELGPAVEVAPAQEEVEVEAPEGDPDGDPEDIHAGH